MPPCSSTDYKISSLCRRAAYYASVPKKKFGSLNVGSLTSVYPRTVHIPTNLQEWYRCNLVGTVSHSPVYRSTSAIFVNGKKKSKSEGLKGGRGKEKKYQKRNVDFGWFCRPLFRFQTSVRSVYCMPQITILFVTRQSLQSGSFTRPGPYPPSHKTNFLQYY